MKNERNSSRAKNLAKAAAKGTIKSVCDRLTKAEGWAAAGTKRAVVEAIKKSLK